MKCLLGKSKVDFITSSNLNCVGLWSHVMNMLIIKNINYLRQSALFCKCFSTVRTMETPIVTVQQGKLKGAIKTLFDGSPYFSFKGIPYAEPPIGELRFRAPLPIKSWTGIREAIEHGPVCPQNDIITSQRQLGSEDCLYLNVYTKSLKPNSKTPVMVYIHGGAFMSGSGNSDTYGPEYLLQHDVILVTINYRLEVLGFLCLETPEVPGNAGIKDQVAAMRWIKENIDKFGGDNKNITLFGESAGAASVTYHMLSPMSKGLFHKAIAQSGVATQDWANAYEAKERAFRLGRLLGKDTNNVNELLEFLKGVPVLDLIGSTVKVRTLDEKYRGLPMHFVPVVESKFSGIERFLEKKPIDILLEGKVNKVPLLTGYNTAEGLLMVKDQLKKKDMYNNKPSYLVPKQIVINVTEEKLQEFGERIKVFYFGNKRIGNETIQEIVDVQTDIHFKYHTHRFAYFYHKFAPIYMYRFDYVTDLNITKLITGVDVRGACHADDLFYIFCSDYNKDYYEEQENLRKIVYQMTKFWTDFAKTGNPTPTNEGVIWPQYTPSTRQCIVLNEEISVETYPQRDRVEFWNKLYSDAGLPCMTKSTI